jgi:hypothetical protein
MIGRAHLYALLYFHMDTAELIALLGDDVSSTYRRTYQPGLGAKLILG